MFFSKKASIISSLVTTFILAAIPQTLEGSHYAITPLVADLPGIAPNTDPNLINPWGIFFVPSGSFWVADNGSNLSTLYRPDGSIINFVVGVAGNPSGTVRNPSIYNFFIGSGMNQHPASFLFSTESGTILGFNRAVDPANAVIAVDNSALGTVYKGLDIGSTCCGQNLLFATDFHNGKIDIFDSSFNFINSMKDYTMPAGFAPFNIRNINGLLYVTYAKQLPPANHDDDPGLGNGYVDIFSTSGGFVKRLVSQGNLNSPWGLALAPSTFGDFGGALLVGNFGDGFINAYDIKTGAFLGQLTDAMGAPLHIDGLWALDFDAKGNLYFTSGPNGEANGLVGTISLLP